jgi:hypothetical protein
VKQSRKRFAEFYTSFDTVVAESLSICVSPGLHLQHCSGITSLLVSEAAAFGSDGALFSAGRDGTVRRWGKAQSDNPSWRATFEAHTDWVRRMHQLTFHWLHLSKSELPYTLNSLSLQPGLERVRTPLLDPVPLSRSQRQ